MEDLTYYASGTITLVMKVSWPNFCDDLFGLMERKIRYAFSIYFSYRLSLSEAVCSMVSTI